MKRLILFLIITTAILFAEPQAFYVNGVGNGTDSTIINSDKSAVKIEDLTNISNVRVLKNTSQGVVMDSIEAAAQMLGFDKVWRALSKSGSSWASKVKSLQEKYHSEQEEKLALKVAHFKLGIKDATGAIDFAKYIASPSLFKYKLSELGFSIADIAIMELKVDFAEDIEILASGLKDVIDSMNYNNIFPTESDKERMKETIQAEICKGNGINIIAHSQGNLMVDQLLHEEFSNMESQIKLISVSSPADRVYGNGLSVKLKEDLVAKTFFSDLPANYSNYPSDKQWMIPRKPGNFLENLSERILRTNYFRLGYTYAYNKINYGNKDWSGHGFVDSYLYSGGNIAPNTKNAIIVKFNENNKLLEKTFSPPNNCPPVEIPEKRENLWLGDIVLEGYGSNVPQMKKIKFDSRVHYSSNIKPSSLKVKICYALSKNKVWDNNFIRGPLYSTKKFTTKESSQKISNVFFYIPKTIPLGDYYLLEKVDCENKIKETDEIENQVKYKKIKVVSQEKEDIRTTDIKISGTGSGKIVIKNTMVYDGSNPDIGWVYQAWFFSTEPKFSTAKQIAITKAKMGWGKNDRKQKQLTADISNLSVGTFYIWVIVKKLDNSHDDDTSNNYFRVSFTTRPRGS